MRLCVNVVLENLGHGASELWVHGPFEAQGKPFGRKRRDVGDGCLPEHPSVPARSGEGRLTGVFNSIRGKKEAVNSNLSAGPGWFWGCQQLLGELA